MGRLIQVVKRVHLAAIYQNFKMYMRACTHTGITTQGNLLALGYRLTLGHQNLA